MARSTTSSASRPPRRTLAVRAEVRAAPGGADLLDSRAAARARLAFAQMDLELVLEGALRPARVAVIVDRRALGIDAGVKHVDDRLVQAFDLLGPERAHRPQRVDLRAPERLVRVDVPHARHALL